MLLACQILNSNPNFLELRDYMGKLGYYHIGRIKGFDYWSHKNLFSVYDTVYWTSPMTNEDYTDFITNDNMPINFYCYAWQWTSSDVYLSENTHKDDPLD